MFPDPGLIRLQVLSALSLSTLCFLLHSVKCNSGLIVCLTGFSKIHVLVHKCCPSIVVLQMFSCCSFERVIYS